MMKLSLGWAKGENQIREMQDYEVLGFLSICGSTYIVFSDFKSKNKIEVREVVLTHQIDDDRIREFPFYLCQESSPMEKYLSEHFSSETIKARVEKGEFIMPADFPDKERSRQSNDIMFKLSETLTVFDGTVMTCELPKNMFAYYRFLAFDGRVDHTKSMANILLKWKGPFSLKLDRRQAPND